LARDDDWRKDLGEAGESAVCQELVKRGWKAERQPGNFRNVDIVATKNGKAINVQVKTHSTYKWVFGGGVNAVICKGAALFNRVGRYPRCEFVVLLSPTTVDIGKGCVSSSCLLRRLRQPSV
jgi:hypothetical protein